MPKTAKKDALDWSPGDLDSNSLILPLTPCGTLTGYFHPLNLSFQICKIRLNSFPISVLWDELGFWNAHLTRTGSCTQIYFLNSDVTHNSDSQLIFDKGAKAIQWRKDQLFSKWCWNNWTFTCKKNESRHRPYTITKIDSKWIIDLNVKCKTIKFLQDNIRQKI